MEELQGGAMVMAWGSVMLQVIGRQLDESLLGEGEEKEKSGWGSSKKWAAWSLNRFVSSSSPPLPARSLANLFRYYPDCSPRTVTP